MSIKFTLLGTGSSLGVPRPDGHWGKCDPNEPKNYRTRCSALISTKNTETLIDTSPDLRFQLLREKIKRIDRVLYSHQHADQTHGINDLRAFFLKEKKKINVFADKPTKKYLVDNFSYCFKGAKGYPATLNISILKRKIIFKDKKDNLDIKCIPVKHGSINCISFIINRKIGYASDVNLIYKKELIHFKKLDFFIIDCLRFSKHYSHYNLNEVLNLVKFLKPKKTILTNLHSDLDYKFLLNSLPHNVLPGYDGLSFKI